MKTNYAILLFFLMLTSTRFLTLTSDYSRYLAHFESINNLEDIERAGYEISDITYITSYFQTTSIDSECTIYPAINKQYGRIALFFADAEGNVLYKTEDLECNYFFKESLYQPNIAIAAMAERDINGDGSKDILIIVRCLDDGNKFKIGDILIQGEETFYRDWRISEKINRFSMDKDINMMMSFVYDGQSAEFLYSASTLDELLNGGFEPLTDQVFHADYEKFGTVKVVPGTYTMGGHHIFILYLVNSERQVVWNFQCMRDYDNFSRMTGISFKDVDGDGWADLSILAEYKSLDDNNELYTAKDFSIYYQRDGYFFEDKDFHTTFFNELTGEEVMDDIVQAARRYWGW